VPPSSAPPIVSLEHKVTQSTWKCLGRTDDLVGDGPFAVSADGLDLVVVRTESRLRAYQGRCPHQGALLGEGEMDGSALVCRNHRWRFDAATGERQGGPGCLVSCPVETRGTELWADVAPLSRTEALGAIARRTLDDLPGPKGLPLVGNVFQIGVQNFHLVQEKWAAEYGPLYVYRLGPNRIVGVVDPRLNEVILRARPETYRRASNVEPVFREMGVDGVFSAEGAAWRRQRRLAMEALSHRNLRGFYPTLQRVTRRLRTRWERKADAGATIDLADELKRFTVDVTTTLTFGHDVNTLEQGDDVIQRRLELVFPAFARRLFAILPTWRWIRMPADRRLDRALAQLREWLGVRIDEARARLESDPARAGHPETFLESMIAARDSEGRPFPNEVIFGNAMTMLLAGEDTTAYTLVWAVHHLCDAPDAASRLRAESDALRGGKDAAPDDIETANRLVYAGAVANEAMRLKPVAPTILLEANHDVVIGDVAVPKGTWVSLHTRPPALDSRNFSDPMAFRPERWLDADATGGVHDPSANIPFGSGPRICPGRTLALLEMKVVLSMLFGDFDVERAGLATDVKEVFAFTMAPVGMRVKLRRRAVRH
jgi:cytochrome P450/nitrite reductase/ring-hydroxylating ferredoxin subunit